MIEADFQRFYGQDLRERVEADGCRRLLALVRALPSDAAVWRHERITERPTAMDRNATTDLGALSAWIAKPTT